MRAACQSLLHLAFRRAEVSGSRSDDRLYLAQDHYDVKMPCHLLLGKLAGAAPDQVRQALPRLVDPLQRTLHAKVKTDAVKQEVLELRDGATVCLQRHLGKMVIRMQLQSAGLRAIV